MRDDLNLDPKKNPPGLPTALKIFILIVWCTVVAVVFGPLMTTKACADPSIPVQVMYSQEHYLKLKDTDLKAYLRQEDYAEYLPEELPFTVICYTDRLYELYLSDSYSETVSLFTNDGRVKLYMALLKFTQGLCDYIEEEFYHEQYLER